MATGIGIIKERFLDCLDSVSSFINRLTLRMLKEPNGEVVVRLDDEICNLLTEIAQRNGQSLEEAACNWIGLQAEEFKRDEEIARCWYMLTDREQKVVAQCCLGYSDQEIANLLGVAYGTARTHLYNAIYKFGINKKSELLFLVRDWDFSMFDRDFSTR